ncbi:MAG: GNAT family N-acetyltransferase [Candidatus Cloacimonetes bacterium]|nr:GNAT family N-acetyltransferase [Candidatus Cloacimonadota bacterium]
MKLKRVRSEDIASLNSIVDLEKELFLDGGLNIWAIQPIAEYQFIYKYGQGDLCAYAILLSKVKDPKTVYLFSFGVAKNQQGKGVGKSFLKELRLELCSVGFTNLELTVASENKAALHLYKSQLEVLSKSFIKGCYGDGEDREKFVFKI